MKHLNHAETNQSICIANQSNSLQMNIKSQLYPKLSPKTVQSKIAVIKHVSN